VATLPDAWFASPGLLSAVEADDLADPRARPALAATYAARAPEIRRFLRGLLGDSAAADDATQETFARAFQRIDTLRDPDRITPWLFGIARNVALEARKERRRLGRVVDPAVDVDRGPEAVDPCTPESTLLGREAVHIVDRALARLSTDRRAVLMLRMDHGVSYEDIAELMGWSLSKTKVEVHRGRLVLREELSRYEGVSP
jgi:RNA polymerase sigma-70 factor, ECF subfamily